MEYTQPALFYTEEEVQAKIDEARLADSVNYTLLTQRVKDNLNLSTAEFLLEVLRIHVSDGLDEAIALSIYNTLARMGNWTELTAISAQEWVVTITCNGEEIGETTISAESEEEAVEAIKDDATVWSLSANVTFMINGERFEYQEDGLEYDLGDHFSDNLEFEACLKD